MKAIEHLTNPLHVYCRLRDLGLSGGISRSLAPLIFPAILFLATCLVGTTFH